MKKIFINIKYYIISLIIIVIFFTVFFSFIPLVNGKTQNIQVVEKTANSVTLKWEKKSQALGYQIKVFKQKNHKLIKKIFTLKIIKQIKHLKTNTVYKFKIRPKYKNKFGKYISIKVRTEKTGDEPAQIINTNSNTNNNSNSNDNINSGINANTNTNTNSNSNINSPVDHGLNIPFGFWGLNGYDTAEGYNYVKNNFNADVYQVYSSGPNYNLNTLLPMVKNANMKISLNITGNYSDFADTEGNFDITLWKNALDHYFNNPDTAIAMQEYVDNNTIIGVMLLDDIYNFIGKDPTAEELEQMACDIKENINTMTWVREDINDNLVLEDASFQFNCLDAFGFQYSTRKGSIADYINDQQQAADNLNVDIVAGLNIADGGDGSSSQQGWSGTGYYAMSADEITTYGEAMLDRMDNVIMFLMWEYDGEEYWPDGTIGSDYFNQPELQRALYNLGNNTKNI